MEERGANIEIDFMFQISKGMGQESGTKTALATAGHFCLSLTRV
jgi:hypothetical protein